MGGVHNMLLGTSITAGNLTLKEVVFNASGTFTMPSGVVDNKIIVGCTGGGGGSLYNTDIDTYGGNGAGRVVSTLTMSTGQTATVTVGAGGLADTSGGGTSSFTGASSCAGGALGSHNGKTPTNGGGRGYSSGMGLATSSSCAAALTLQAGAIDKTTGLWTAKSYAGGRNFENKGGGGGCYGVGSGVGNTLANSGGGGFSYSGNGGSGKVVVWYYVYE